LDYNPTERRGARIVFGVHQSAGSGSTLAQPLPSPRIPLKGGERLRRRWRRLIFSPFHFSPFQLFSRLSFFPFFILLFFYFSFRGF
jgi:hypothetical protein